MKKFSGIILSVAIVALAAMSLTGLAGCGGGSSSQALPTPTPTPGQIFPNDTASAQAAPVKLGTSGANSTDVGATVCCIGTLGSLWTRADITNPVILSNNHVLNQSDNGKATPGDSINQPVQLVCTAKTAPAPLTVAHLTQAAKLKPVANETGQPCAGDNTKAALCGHAPSNVDAAIAEIVSGQVDTSGTILDQGAVGASSIAAAAPSSVLGTPTLGEAVGKTGRSSGLTCSTIQSLVTTILIDYDSVCGGTTPAFTAYFNNQLVIAGGAFSAGGDSGSLIVDTGTARAVGLLYGGNSASTTANPIQDVVNALTTPATLTSPALPLKIVGGADHAISCARTASASNAQVGAAQSALAPQERQRVSVVQKARTQSLMRDFGVASVEVGPSSDNPYEGALVLHVSGKSVPTVPAVIDGVRTRLVFDAPGALAQLPAISAEQISHTAAVKEAHVLEYLGKSGIQGVGVTLSGDNPTETAIAIYVVKGQNPPAVPAMIDGIRTKVFEGTRFHTY
jgi:hypothetical protein